MNWELHVLGQFHCTFLVLTLLLKGKVLSVHVKGPSSLPIMLKLKRILSYIYKQRSHASCCLSKIDIPVVQNDSLSCCSFLEHLHSTSCQQTGLWFKRLNNNYSVIILQHSMSSGNHTADHPLKIALMSMSLSKVLLSRDCLSVQFVYFNLLYIPHFQLRERRWMEINNDTFTIRFLWQRPLLRCCGFNATTTQWQTSFVNDRSNCKVKIIASWKKKKKESIEDTISTVCLHVAVFPTKSLLWFMSWFILFISP